MDIIQADLDWISLLFLLLAAGSGLARGLGKKRRAMEAEIPETGEGEEIPAEQSRLERAVPSVPAAAAGKKEEDLAAGEEKGGSMTCPQEDEEEHVLDIRQAVISSEILRRPEF